jgi:acyl carrier protein
MDGFVEPRVRRIVADVLGVDAALLEVGVSLRDDLALDSLDLVELLSAIEEDLQVVMPRKLPSWVRTYGDVVELLTLLIPSCAPNATIVCIPPPGSAASQVTRCEALTPYAVEIVVDDAQRLGPGTELDVTLDNADDIALARVRSAFGCLAAHGISVHVHRTGARPHPHAA